MSKTTSSRLWYKVPYLKSIVYYCDTRLTIAPFILGQWTLGQPSPRRYSPDYSLVCSLSAAACTFILYIMCKSVVLRGVVARRVFIDRRERVAAVRTSFPFFVYPCIMLWRARHSILVLILFRIRVADVLRTYSFSLESCVKCEGEKVKRYIEIKARIAC